MEFKFSKHEVESKFYKVLEYGDETEIAKRVDTSEAYISMMYNPDNERDSNLLKAIREISAQLDNNQERGCKMIRLFNHFVNRHVDADGGCATSETRKLLNEWKEFLESAMESKPLSEQIEELEDVQFQTQRLLEAKRRELQKQEIKQMVFANSKN